ncbi:hypothetical protein Sjap_024415 [Stephania japonica]|uniref:Uncharacterized protein n=1 Tax=Stephania japonica TaxID=461633 RepID=A0AAP0EKK5_9MAGN
MAVAESNDDSHVVVVVEISGEKCRSTEQHPLMEISESPGHLLLLKLWQRQEDLLARRVAIKETRLDSVRSDAFHSCCFFYAFYSLFITLVYASSSSSTNNSNNSSKCQCWWIPSVVCASTCVAMALLVQIKLWRYWKVRRQLERERAEARAVNRGIQELRMKGVRFDLSKDGPAGQRGTCRTMVMKSSSVEPKWTQPLAWCSHYFITIFLLCLTGVALPATKFILCTDAAFS